MKKETQDYIPRKDNALLPWASNLEEKIDLYSKVLNISAEDVTLIKDNCSGISTGITTYASAAAVAKKAAKDKISVVSDGKTVLRKQIQAFKKNPNFTAGMGQDMGVIGTSNPFSPDTYKVKLTGTSLAGKVNIKFAKKGVPGINIYSKLKTEDKWTLLSFAGKSPYADKRPLMVAATAETRQYMAMGVMNDAEIGLMSDIIEVVFGG